MKLYPFEVPADWHPYSWLFFGLGLTKEQIDTLSRRLIDDLGMRPVTTFREESFSWVVDWPDDHPERVRVEVGDEVNILVAGQGAVRVTGGSLPPGVRLDRATGRIRGTFTHPGLYECTVTVGPAVKYDSLGSPGGPGDPGMFIPIGQPRQEPLTRLAEFPASVEDLDARAKDHLLAELLAWRDGETIGEAEQ